MDVELAASFPLTSPTPEVRVPCSLPVDCLEAVLEVGEVGTGRVSSVQDRIPTIHFLMDTSNLRKGLSLVKQP